MAVISTFKALPFDVFQDAPAGRNDPFVLTNDDPAELLSVSVDDDDATLDGDTITNETPDDANQIATVTDADGNLVSTDACYIEWTATYTGTNGQVIEVWRFELDNGLRMFAVSEIPEAGITFNTDNKDQQADGLDPADNPADPLPVAGTENEDLLNGTAKGETINALDDADIVLGGGGDDTIFGGADADALTGNAGNDTVSGDDGNDLVFGAEGDDVLYGGEGDDLLVGQAGADDIFGGAGEDTIQFFNLATGIMADLSDQTNNTGEAAGDTYAEVENLHGSNGVANTLIGDDNDNDLIGGDQADVLTGNGGADSIDGGAGDDQMAGGAGDDQYQVDSAGDVVTELAGEGYDRVVSTVTYTLSDEVEMGTLRGTGDLDLTGSATNNWLNGNVGANTLDGGDGRDRLHGNSGDDVLDGGADNDVLFGGAGADTFRFAASDGTDVIYDFEAGTDTIQFASAGVSAFGDLELLDVASGARIDYGSGFVIVSGAAAADLDASNFDFI